MGADKPEGRHVHQCFRSEGNLFGSVSLLGQDHGSYTGADVGQCQLYAVTRLRSH